MIKKVKVKDVKAKKKVPAKASAVKSKAGKKITTSKPKTIKPFDKSSGFYPERSRGVKKEALTSSLRGLQSRPKQSQKTSSAISKKRLLRSQPVIKPEVARNDKMSSPAAEAFPKKVEIAIVKKIEASVTKKIEEKTIAKQVPSPVKETIQSPMPPIEEIQPVVEVSPAVEEVKTKTLELDLPIALKDLASKIGVKSNEIIMKLMSKNIFATINQGLGEEMVKDILKDYGTELRKPVKIEAEVVKEHREMEGRQDVKNIVTRPPVVTFMGHVDHGKTSLLDFIRKTRVADKEKGGITQHIGAYEVRLANGSVTFLDTPGHEAFTAMRARGASATDVVVLVVAADDGVMPQTKEAVDHARAAGATIVVALNKCDLPGANIDKVKGQLSQIGLSPEDWGGKTVTVAVSAKTGEGVDKLLEMLLLESELLELKANPSLKARGVVIEGKLSSGQGPVATILVKNGTLHLGDMVLSGSQYGRVKAMINHKG
ncbi:MAG: translation initiation factor IF-2 N-terminal domain-containing protein, partial [Candidatus Omnitrophota bacterium]|nr:translation initiation factor IF-2 N-terminal domain-containing protein [Candidatus Omnitrophota bacterium]